MNDFERRNRSLFPISIVMELAELSARQIRYYEEQGLIKPARTKGRHRLFSFSDIDRLLEIKSLLDKGINLAGIKEILIARDIEKTEKELKKIQAKEQISYAELRKKLKQDILNHKPGRGNSLIQGDLSRFFH